MPYTTFQTSHLLDDLCNAYDIARATPDLSQRWQNALAAAWEWLLEQDSIQYDIAAGELVYASESGVTYRANGQCQCRAFEEGQPCKHRAAARLVRNAVRCLSAREMAELFAA